MAVGSQTHFASLYDAHYGHVYAYCRRRVHRDTVDDVVSEVFLQVWRRIGDAPSGEDAIRWLYRVAYLVTSNHWRRSTRKKQLDEKLASVAPPPPAAVADQIVVRDEVRHALSILEELRPGDKEIIKLSVWEQLSHDDIAAVLGISQQSARQRLHRARKRLARAYEKQTNQSGTPAARRGGEW